MSTSIGPPGWAAPPTNTAPDPALAVQPPAPAEPAEPAPAAPADPDVYVRPPRREPAPEWTPPGAPAPFVLTAVAAPGHAFVPDDRRQFDGRRLKAWIVDQLCLAVVPFLLAFSGALVTEGVWLVYLGFVLIYFFLCEVTTGQTVGKRLMGLRVVMRDGTPAPAKAVSARTVLRLIDGNVFGLVLYVLSGGARRRLGDYAAGTIVVDAFPDPGRPPKSPLLVIYPVVWLIGAVVGFSAIGHGGDVYLADLDAMCREANAVVASAPAAERSRAAMTMTEAKLEALASFMPPSNRMALHAEIFDMERAVLAEARLAQRRIAADPAVAPAELARMGRVAAPMRARYAQLGLKHCAA